MDEKVVEETSTLEKQSKELEESSEDALLGRNAGTTRSTILETFFLLDEMSPDEREVSRGSATRSEESTSTAVSHQSQSQKGEFLRCYVSNFPEYSKFVNNHDATKSLYIYFTGTDSPNSGYSWCRDCQKASPVIERALKHLHTGVFLVVYVGLEDDWLDKLNPYRLDRHIKLRIIPTIWKYGTPRKLEGKYCWKRELIELLFEEGSD